MNLLKHSLLALKYADEDFVELMLIMPILQFPAHWQIKLMPPFAGAPIRFWASIDNFKDTHVSIYFDAKDVLASVGRPYWELYPSTEGDNLRYFKDDIHELFQGIESSLQSQLNKMEH